ncbi:MAG TPA: chemotaxis protein CheD [Nitrospirae bacterium]|nr:chemoreceptor glutamine deamidase CheD [bacterium BMS3Abin06]HDH01143.1 chemotaxis protein CheD [Nitrospirota bacterium]HDH11225.1 chemotaxis protein CheD [Nitrospirota bacterium]HDZ02466.1 chemotaxis protein CheD [Nitrospirota bacterium]
METKEAVKTHFLHPGGIFADKSECLVTTILGSCVSVCLLDPVLKISGINHYMLALWNGEGLPSPRYGNIAITKLIEKMLGLGSKKQDLRAKVFGGASLIQSSSGFLNIGKRNILIAEDMLRDENIQIISRDVEGNAGRKLILNTKTGSVLLKKVIKKQIR